MVPKSVYTYVIRRSYKLITPGTTRHIIKDDGAQNDLQKNWLPECCHGNQI